MNETKFDIAGLVERTIRKAGLDNRSQTVLENRFGLFSPDPSTLQELGDVYNITRERIRQVEVYAVNRVKIELKKLSEADDLLDFTKEYLDSSGGIKRHEQARDELRSLFKSGTEPDIFGNQIKFIYRIAEYPKYFRENDTYHDFWYLGEDVYRRLHSIHTDLIKKLKCVEHFEEVLRQAIKPHGVTEVMAMNYLSVSKKIGIGPYGDLGLSHWEEINPRTVRAKIYLVLKKHPAPMHFREIAETTGCHPPTVHNELIKDRRFKLVSRGTYIL
jgi:hypothetical protein